MEGGMETPEKERWKKDKEGGREGGREGENNSRQ